MLSLAHRFYHVGAKYRYDWRVDLLSGEVLLLTTDSSAMGDIILDAKWQGDAFGDPVWLDRLVGQSLPLAMTEDTWQAAIAQGVWLPFGAVSPKHVAPTEKSGDNGEIENKAIYRMKIGDNGEIENRATTIF